MKAFSIVSGCFGAAGFSSKDRITDLEPIRVRALLDRGPEPVLSDVAPRATRSDQTR